MRERKGERKGGMVWGGEKAREHIGELPSVLPSVVYYIHADICTDIYR
jgi:hypothetical protein